MSLLAPNVIGGIVQGVTGVIDDLHTSDEERRAADLEETRENNKLLLGQMDVNKEEAKHASLFVAGWRPAAGWVLAQALWFAFVPKAIVLTALWVYASWKVVNLWSGAGLMPALPDFPDLGIVDILGMLGGMMGLGWMRHKETVEGKARSEPLTPLKIPSLRRAPAEVEAP